MLSRMWAVDVEGSGESPPEIVELAIAEMEGLRLTGRRKHWRFKPQRGISPIAARIHGIWDRDVADAPEFDDVTDDLLTWLEDRPIVGHNVRVDFGMLSDALEEWRPVSAYDTLRLARRLLPLEKKHGLEHLGARLKLQAIAAELTGGNTHSAPFDAVMSALLMTYLLEPLSESDREAALIEADILRGAQGLLL